MQKHLRPTKMSQGLNRRRVPVLAALGGILFLGEPLTLRLVLASAAILAGIALVLPQKNPAEGNRN